MLPNKKRLSLSLFITIKSGKPIHYEWKQTVIENKKFSYKQAEDMKQTDKLIKDLYQPVLTYNKIILKKK